MLMLPAGDSPCCKSCPCGSQGCGAASATVGGAATCSTCEQGGRQHPLLVPARQGSRRPVHACATDSPRAPHQSTLRSGSTPKQLHTPPNSPAHRAHKVSSGHMRRALRVGMRRAELRYTRVAEWCARVPASTRRGVGDWSYNCRRVSARLCMPRMSNPTAISRATSTKA
jgi:hypothetical protein